MKTYETDSPEFSNMLNVFETTDPAHADLVNGVNKQLFENTLVLKEKLDTIDEGANKYTHPNSVVSAGTYRSVTVDEQGHVTAGTNPTTLAGYGITDAATASHTHNYAGSTTPGGNATYAQYLAMNTSPADLNSLGAYNLRFMGTPTANYPQISGQWVIGDQYVHNTSWVIQRGNQFANDYYWYQRGKFNGTWYPWFVDLNCCLSASTPAHGCLWIS